MIDSYADTAVFVVGLPESGKSTFLAALWHSVEQGRADAALVVDHLAAGDRTYLNSIARQWSDGAPLERTFVTGGGMVTIALRSSMNDRKFSVTFPDLAGEVFRDAWASRSWPAAVNTAARSARSVLLFLHPDIREPARIDRATELATRVGQPEPAIVEGTPSGAATEADVIKWNPLDSPHAVILVDLLQIISELIDDPPGHIVKVAVVISAWDLIDHATRFDTGAERRPSVSPEFWLSQHAPLLTQFLATNTDRFDSRFYGLTAQGGDLTKDADRLVSATSPEDRILLVYEANSRLTAGGDPSAIIDWLTI